MKKKIAVLFTMMLSIGSATVANAETSTGSLDVNGGNLSLNNVPANINFPAMTIDGINWKKTSADIGNVRVTDGRGTGEGWNLTVSSTQLTEVGGLGLTLPAGTLNLYAPTTVTPVGDTNAPSPTLGAGSHTVDSSPFTIATAGANKGLGTYDLGFDNNAIEINVHPSQKIVDITNYPAAPTPYQATITWTLNNTP
ncbi:WxL domain-containing protein [Bacillus cereus]|uniref:WxL domain-containing protein n=1 Tax=Bacillus cereus TaxID=1396 RepID=UPI00307A55D2